MKKLLFKYVYLFLHIIGKIHSPYSKKRIDYKDVEKALEVLELGDIIVTRTDGELTSLVIPGFWKHAAIYTGKTEIVDATGEGVKKRRLEDLLMKTDSFAIMRLKTNDEVVRGKMAMFALSKVGLPYDYTFDINDTTSFYCSELIFSAVNTSLGDDFLDLRDCLGFKTFTPQDCYNATKKFDLILENSTKIDN